jgi:DNA repair protein SbcC/Rad50
VRLRRLRLQNYRQLAEVELDLGELGAAVITGPNGVGKSSIIEGLIWTLYGTSRSTSVDGVVRIGQTDCVGEVDFDAGDQSYRVIRKRSTRTSAGKTELELYMRTAAGWTSLSEKGARLTQAAIVEHAGVDVDTLLATSVVMQGDAGRLTRARPEERRAILRNVLQLDRWVEWATTARANHRDAFALAGRSSALAEEVLGVADANAHSETLAATLARAEGYVDQADIWIEAFEKREADAIHSAALRTAEAAEAERLARGAGGEWEKANARVETTQGIANAAGLEGMNLAIVEQAESALPEVRAGLVQADRERADHARRLELARKRDELRRECAALNDRIKFAQGAVEAAQADEDAAANLPRLRVDLDVAKGASERWDVLSAAEVAAVNALSEAKPLVRMATDRLATLKRAASRLESAPCTTGASWRRGVGLGEPCDLAGTCPLISDAVAAAAEVEGAEAQVDYHAELLNTAQAKHAEAAAHLNAAPRPDVSKIAADVARAEAALRGAARAEGARAEEVAARSARRDVIAQGTHLSAELDGLLPGNGSQWDDLDRERVRLERIAAQRGPAERAAAAAERIAGELGELKQARADAKATLDRLVEAHAAAAGDAALAEATAKTAGRLVTAGRMGAAEIDGSLGDANRAASEFIALLERAQKHFDAAAFNHQLAAEWHATAEACTVAPVLIIETMIPALEEHANAVLSDISSRGMQVRIETQRVIGSGELREALEIIVRDDVGERPYEDFSGGEQFRLDIALRLGLSRLLAQREGVPVSFLVIDEGGFGALDVEGIDAVKEVVAGLVRKYPLVLVITHIDDVADCLPRRIMLARDDSGETTIQTK